MASPNVGALRSHSRVLGFVALTAIALSALGVAAVSLSAALVGLTGTATASSGLAVPALPPSYCAAPPELAADEVFGDAQGSRPLLTYVNCIELRQWRSGLRERFDVIGRVSLQTGVARERVALIAAEAAGPAEALAELAAETGEAGMRRVMAIAAAMDASGAASADLGQAVEDEIAYAATLLRRAPGALHVRMSATPARGDGPATRRELLMPLDGGDTLRYMRAVLRAGLAADRVAQIATMGTGQDS